MERGKRSSFPTIPQEKKRKFLEEMPRKKGSLLKKQAHLEKIDLKKTDRESLFQKESAQVAPKGRLS